MYPPAASAHAAVRLGAAQGRGEARAALAEAGLQLALHLGPRAVHSPTGRTGMVQTPLRAEIPRPFADASPKTR